MKSQKQTVTISTHFSKNEKKAFPPHQHINTKIETLSPSCAQHFPQPRSRNSTPLSCVPWCARPVYATENGNGARETRRIAGFHAFENDGTRLPRSTSVLETPFESIEAANWRVTSRENQRLSFRRVPASARDIRLRTYTPIQAAHLSCTRALTRTLKCMMHVAAIRDTRNATTFSIELPATCVY